IISVDNLDRRGSELNLPRLEAAGVQFVRGDVRDRSDLQGLPPITALVECSAEPSAMSGVDGDTSFVFETNVTGAYNCLELARRGDAFVVFLSPSRGCPVAALGDLASRRGETRVGVPARAGVPGAAPPGP